MNISITLKANSQLIDFTPDPRNGLASKDLTAGFSLVELMIVIAIVAIILTMALPVYSNYSIRSKVTEAFNFASTAKSSVQAICKENSGSIEPAAEAIRIKTKSSNPYIGKIEIAGTCSNPVIKIITENTGVIPSPDLIISGEFGVNLGQIDWHCSSNGQPNHLPDSCRG